MNQQREDGKCATCGGAMAISDEHSLEPWKYLSLLTRCATPLILTPGDLPNANLGWPGEMDDRMTKKKSHTAYK